MASNKIEIVIGVKDIASGALGKLSGTLTKLSSVAIKAGAALGAIAGGASIKAFADFESAFVGVQKTVNATAEEFVVLEQGIRDMAKTLPASAESIAGVAEAAGQLGIETGSILSFSKTMIDLGNATNLSANQAATSLARLANITGLPQSEFDRLGATVVGLGNSLATTEAEIVEMSLRLAGAGNQIGLTEADILSLSGALSSVGIRAEAGGSAMSRTMISMAEAVNAGGEELKLFADVAGSTVDEFKQSFETDAGESIVSFIEGLGRMDAEGRNVFGTLEDLGFAEIRIKDALLRASGAGDLFRKSLELGSKSWEENTALTTEAEKRYATLSSQFQITLNNIKDIAIEIGSRLAPTISEALKATVEFGNTFKNVILNLPEIVSAVAQAIQSILIRLFTDVDTFKAFLDGFLVIMGAILDGMGRMVLSIGNIILNASAVIWVPFMEGFVWVGDQIRFVMETAMKNVRGLVIGTMLGIVEKVNSILPDMFQIDTTTLKGTLDDLAEELIKPAKTLEESFHDAGSGVLGAILSIGDNLGDIGAIATENLGVIFDKIGELGDSPEVELLKNRLKGVFEEAGVSALEFSDVISEDLIASAETTTLSLQEIWAQNFESWLGGWTDTLTAIQELSTATWESFKQGAGDAIGGAIVFGEDLGESFKALMQNIAKNIISMLVQIGIQRLAQAVLTKAIVTKEASTRLGVLSAETFAGAFASTVAIPIIGPAIAPAVAGASQAAMLAGATASAATGSALGATIGQAHDGISNIPREGTFMLDQGERVLSADQNTDFTNMVRNGRGGGGSIVIEEFNLFPEANFTQSLMDAPLDFWVELAQDRILPALNELGGNGSTTTLTFREENF